MSDDQDRPTFRRRRAPSQWVQAGRGLALVTGLALAVGVLGLLVAWLASLVA